MNTHQQREVFNGHTYAASELLDTLRAGPYADEDFHRLQVTGKLSSKWVNITPDQLRRIATILDEEA
jgi:hypothetical protein